MKYVSSFVAASLGAVALVAAARPVFAQEASAPEVLATPESSSPTPGGTAPAADRTPAAEPTSGAASAADPDVGFRARHLAAVGAEPTDYLFRIGPCLEDFRRRRLDAAREGEAGLGGHVSLSTNAARCRRRICQQRR